MEEQGRVEGHHGIHKPLMTMAEFRRIQQILNKKGQSKDWTNPLPLQGLFECGYCHATITGEKHLKKYKSGKQTWFFHYRCTKKLGPCPEKYLNADRMDNQVKGYVEKIEYKSLAKERENQTKRLADIDKQKFELRQMKAEGWFPDEKVYQDKKSKLLQQEQLIKQEIVITDDSHWDALFEKLMNFAQRVMELYETKDPKIVRLIVEIIGSNFVLQDGKLKIKAKMLL